MLVPNRNLKVVAINSFAVHGTASLKAITAILGSRVLPVPSVILDGLTNLPGVTKFPSPLRELLKGTFDLAKYRNLEVILYIGYLGKREQIETIIELISEYKDFIRFIITDPICGDHGKPYVPEEIISSWPKLLKISDLVFPNLTEVKLLSGFKADEAGEDSFFINQFLNKYQAIDLVVTSLRKSENEIGIQLYQGKKLFSYYHSAMGRDFGGSGDTLVALFIRYHFFKQMSIEDSLIKAANETSHFILKSIEQGVDELLIEEQYQF